MKDELIDYNDMLDSWYDKVIKKADEMYEKSEGFELGSPKYFKYKSYADGLYMATSMLNNEERIYKRNIKNEKNINNITLGQISLMTKCCNCGFNLYIYPNQEKVVCGHCNTINDLKLMKFMEKVITDEKS